MICAEYDINKAKGLRLFNAVKLKGRTLPKGHELTAADLEDLKKLGLRKIFAAQMEENDISFEAALGILAVKLCGEHTAYSIGDDGVAKIVAVADGIFECSEDRVAKFNRLSEQFILNTISVFSKVKAGEIIAELSTGLPIITQNIIDDIIYSLSGNSSLLKVVAGQQHNAALLYTRFYNNAEENKHFTAVVEKLVKDLGAQDVSFNAEYSAVHQIKELTDLLELALHDDNDLIFIVPGQKSNCREDTLPAALQNFVDEIVVYGLAQIGVSDLIIASKRNKKIICLPYNYDKINSPLLNSTIFQAIASEKLLAFDFAHPQNVVLPAGETLTIREQARLVGTSSDENNKSASNVAAIVLAAGLSRRAGRNKLLVDVDGEPLFMKAVHAAVKSKASPVYVITGYEKDVMAEALENVDVNILYNPAYRTGVKTSIALGLKTVPGYCGAAILLPADMPGVTDKHLNNLIKTYKPGKGAQLCTSAIKGVKSNPVLWSRELFDYADIMPENAGVRIVYPQYEDITQKVEAKEKILQDITYSGDLEPFTQIKK